MAIQLWPASHLPKPLLATTSFDVDPGLRRTRMESGTARQRRQFTTEPLFAALSWHMSDTQIEIFDAFVKHRLTRGADWFQATFSLNLSAENDYICRMVNGRYTARRNSNIWAVSANIEIEDRESISEAALEAIIGPPDVDNLNTIAGDNLETIGGDNLTIIN